MLQDLSPFGAVVACAGLSCSFVGCIYILKRKLTLKTGRNHPEVIKSRTMMSAVVSALSPLVVKHTIGLNWSELIRAIGLSKIPDLSVMINTSALFTGSAILRLSDAVDEGRAQNTIATPEMDWKLARDLIFGPVFEEIVFRGCMVALLEAGGFSHLEIVMICPLFFGAAHLHHLMELITIHQVDWNYALQVVGFQFLYTSLFGMFSTHLFISSGSLFNSIIAHSVCNYMGVPEFDRVARHKFGALIGLGHVFGIYMFIQFLRHY